MYACYFGTVVMSIRNSKHQILFEISIFFKDMIKLSRKNVRNGIMRKKMKNKKIQHRALHCTPLQSVTLFCFQEISFLQLLSKVFSFLTSLLQKTVFCPKNVWHAFTPIFAVNYRNDSPNCTYLKPKHRIPVNDIS